MNPLSAYQCLQVLGLKAGASREEIRQAYHDLVKVWHPDRFAHDARLQKQAEEKLKEINEAHDFLIGAAGAPPPRPARPEPAEAPQPKDKDWMMPIVSFIVLLIAVGVVSLVFYIYGREHDPVHTEHSSQGLM